MSAYDNNSGLSDFIIVEDDRDLSKISGYPLQTSAVISNTSYMPPAALSIPPFKQALEYSEQIADSYYGVDEQSMFSTGYSSFLPYEQVPRGLYETIEQPNFTQPGDFIRHSLNFTLPTSPSLSSSSTNFDFTSGPSTGVSITTSDQGSPLAGPEEWPFNYVDEVNTNFCNPEYPNWTSIQYEQPEPVRPFVDPSMISNMSRQSSIQEAISPLASPITASPKSHRRQSSMRHSPYPISRPASVASNDHKRSLSVKCTEEFITEEPSSPNKERSRSSTASSPSSLQQKDSWCFDCGKGFRDLKAHNLTHQTERPRKCPISTCDYAKKGFARKYDCQRHILTHYKGTMVCGFCPGSGLSSEKTFNRADVFKRHLMSVHNVEQTPPNSRSKKNSSASDEPSSPCTSAFPDFAKGITGKCSTCSITFQNAQQFYEHLDDCVLSKVCQPEPAGDINAANLAQIKVEDMAACDIINGQDEEEDNDDEEEENDAIENKDENHKKFGRSKGSHKSVTGISGQKTQSRGKITKASRKNRKNFPADWGTSTDRMVSKRRSLMVYDGSKRLLRDDMMMSAPWEVKTNMGGAAVSDLDFWSITRANAYHDAAKQEREATSS